MHCYQKISDDHYQCTVEFHEEDFRLKEFNRESLNEVFTELEFRNLGKRLLGDEFNAFATAPEGVQTDLFGNTVQVQKARGKKIAEAIEEVVEEISEAVQTVDKNIHNCPHDYKAIEGDEAIKALVKELMTYDEICFDTETTGIDANDAELVGFSFSEKACKGYFVPCPTDQTRTRNSCTVCRSFNDEKSLGRQNLKYDLLLLKGMAMI
jgi:DNA polymerase-1